MVTVERGGGCGPDEGGCGAEMQREYRAGNEQEGGEESGARDARFERHCGGKGMGWREGMGMGMGGRRVEVGGWGGYMCVTDGDVWWKGIYCHMFEWNVWGRL